MTTSLDLIYNLLEHGNCAQAHFQTWWALRNRALPAFHGVMNEEDVRRFFFASNSGHYKLIFLELGKIFDSDSRASGLSVLKAKLREEGKGVLADQLNTELAPLSERVRRLLTIRAQTIAHREHARSTLEVYEENGISPNEIREVIENVADAINNVAEALGCSNRITKDRLFEEAALRVLEKLHGGKA